MTEAAKNNYPRTYAPKYAATKDLPLKEVAKLIRKDLKKAIKEGVIPEGTKVSVTTRRNAIDCDIREVAFEVRRFPTEDEVKYDGYHPNERVVMTEEGKRVHEEIEKIRKAYGYNGSDMMTDYFDVRYYGHTQYSRY